MTSEAEIRAALRLTWAPFFSRFGRLTEVQRQAIPRVLAGENLLVVSPAASGKTEAVVAPAIERLLPERRGRFSILYVSPTRALVNDLYRRLSGPLEYLELQLGRKTGDHPAIDESRVPFLLLTTPESFDSLLCRHTALFRDLAAVVLDELHLVDNTPRGDQLRVLLERLRLVNPGVRGCAASATVDDLAMGGRYFPDTGVVSVAARRQLDEDLVPMDDGWPERVVDRLRERECRKVLCFFNARSLAESTARCFDRPPFAGRVWVHHASLTREVREHVESAMNRERIGLLCCTSTLELGIDIGDVDAVVLVRPPFNVSSLLQRIGRGNRRRQSWLYAIGVFRDPWERLLFETQFDCARAGRLYEKGYTPCRSVIPQQVFSYLFQRRRVGATPEAVRRALAPLGDEVDAAFRHLAETGSITAPRPGIYFLSPKLERKVELGKIHSNIQDKTFGHYEVFEVSSNRRLGTVFFVFHHFVLGGRSWELVEHREKEKKLLVRPAREVSANTKVFEGTGTGGYSCEFARVLKQRLFPELAPDQFPFFEDTDQAYFVDLLGATYGYVLCEAYAAEGMPVSDMDGKLLVFPPGVLEAGPGRFPLPGRDAVREVVGRNLARFEDSLGSGAFFRDLPRDLQVEDHLLTLDIEGLYRFLAGLELVELPAERVSRSIARHLAAGGQLTAS